MPFDASSTYTNQYPAHEVQARQAHHAPHPKGGLDLVLRLNPYRSHTASQVRQCQGALPHSLTSPVTGSSSGLQAALALPQHSFERNFSCAGPNVPFDGTSSYEKDFPAHAVQRREQHAPVQAQKDCTPFDATSSYKVLLMACRYKGQGMVILTSHQRS